MNNTIKKTILKQLRKTVRKTVRKKLVFILYSKNVLFRKLYGKKQIRPIQDLPDK